jgi:(1->4)-alpha-D-glucan 1-alpha-D-glucosylmutase
VGVHTTAAAGAPLQFPHLQREKQESWLRFVRRWQQYTGAIMAKGLEDTALYIYNCLTSLNEVGSEARPVTLAEFHRLMPTAGLTGLGL